MPYPIRDGSEFTFHAPVKLHHARGAIDRLGELLPPARRILLVTGQGSARRTGLLARVQAALAGHDHVEVFEGVEPNPSVATVQRGAEIARQRMSDLVIGLGGGSALDAAKVIAALATNEGGFAANAPLEALPAAPLPMVAVPTTCGTGSEANRYAIITDPTRGEMGDKVNFSTDQTYPALGVLDPSVLDALPDDILIDTALDAFCHALEGYTSRRSQPLPDALAAEAMALVIGQLPAAVAGDRDARANLLWASAIAGVVINHTGTTVLHALGYYLTLKLGIPHGRANAMLVPVLLDYLREQIPAKVRHVLSLFDAASPSLPAVRAYLDRLGVESRLSDRGFGKADLGPIIEYTINKRNTALTVGTVDQAVLNDLLSRYA